MKIYGKEYGLRFTVGASIEISRLCPGGRLENLDQVFQLPEGEMMEFVAKMAVAMNAGYRMAKAFEAGVPVADFHGDEPELTIEGVMSMDADELGGLVNELISMQKKDGKSTVEVATSKKKTAKPHQKSG